ncbi:MAG TPA: mandelate racemase/muconate lactonizing enzyme family protein [Geminicoccaceae bacterium]|nr:mandelate racemase/muconate lactonizing enzyme family protein [Geminicoccaceae bacterium]
MKIIDVEALYLRLPEIQARTDSSQDALIVKVSTDAGITGWGEVDGCPYVAKAVIEAPMSHTLVTGLRQLLIGEDPLEITRLWRKMYQGTLYYGREGAVIQAMAGIDLALWDIKGKALQQPVYKLLGGGFRKRLRVYSSNMFQFTAEATADRAKRAQDAGFTAVKFGWEPFGQDARTDCAYLEAIRAAIGDEMDIMLDVGLIWDAKTTLQRARLFEPYRLAWIEEPLHPDDLQGYARVAQNTDTRIAAGEEECTIAGFTRLMEVGQIDVVQVDLTRCGLTQALTIAKLAEQRGLPVINHNFTTDINVAASLHFLASVPNSFIMEYCVEPSEISRSLAKNPIPIVDGHATVLDEPGFGVEPNPAMIEKYLVR